MTWKEELEKVRGVIARMAATVPQVTAAEPLLRQLATSAAVVGPDPGVLVHGDFRPAHVLLHRGLVGVIDLDGACTAEPALDVGRFRATLRDLGVATQDGTAPLAGAALDARLRLLDGLCGEFLAAYRHHADVTLPRVVLWELTWLLTALLHAWTRVRVRHVGPRLTNLRHVLATASPAATGL